MKHIFSLMCDFQTEIVVACSRRTNSELHFTAFLAGDVASAIAPRFGAVTSLQADVVRNGTTKFGISFSNIRVENY